MKNLLLKTITLTVILLPALSTTVYADRDKFDKREKLEKREFDKRDFDKRDYGNPQDRFKVPQKKLPDKHSPDFRFDKRFDHNRRYPREGVMIERLPDRRYPIRYRDRSYFYFGGTWYLPSGPRYVVVRPPIGIIVPILPSFYTTIWFGGVPYYYANDVYYVWRPDVNGYQVAEPPLEESQPPPPLVADELFVYPKEGQSEEKQAEDRYACHRWGVEQTNYDPTQPPSNLPVNELSRLREDYQRAMKACLEGRGYSVR